MWIVVVVQPAEDQVAVAGVGLPRVGRCRASSRGTGIIGDITIVISIIVIGRSRRKPAARRMRRILTRTTTTNGRSSDEGRGKGCGGKGDGGKGERGTTSGAIGVTGKAEIARTGSATRAN
jgi:hypothetical protein